MIRIADEPIFTLTTEERERLMREYQQLPATSKQTFEHWLHHVRRWPYTTYQMEQPMTQHYGA